MKRALLVLTSVILVTGCSSSSHRTSAMNDYGYNYDLVLPRPNAGMARLDSAGFVPGPVVVSDYNSYASSRTSAATSDGVTVTDPSLTVTSAAPASTVIVEGSGASPANIGVVRENTASTDGNAGVNGIVGTTPLLIDGKVNGQTGTSLASNSTNLNSTSYTTNGTRSTMSSTNNLGISALDTNKSIPVSFAKAPTNAIVQEAAGAQRLNSTNTNFPNNNGNRFITNQAPNTVQQQGNAIPNNANGTQQPGIQQPGIQQNGQQINQGQTNNTSSLGNQVPISGISAQQQPQPVNGAGNQNQVTPGGQPTPSGQANSGAVNTTPSNTQNAQGTPAPVPSTGTSAGAPQNRPAPTPATGTSPIGAAPANQH